MTIEEENAQLREENKRQAQRIAELEREVSALQAQVSALLETISELKEQLQKNSQNSSKPPSSDGLKKPKPSSLRQKSGRKAGGQPGHKGHGLRLSKEPDEIVVHRPTECTGCPYQGQCSGCGQSPRRNEVDVEVKVHVTAHETEQYACPLRDNAIISGTFPETIQSSMQYGKGVHALATLLNTAGAVSTNRTADIMRDVFGIPISRGTIAKMVSRFAKTIAGTVAEIPAVLRQAPVVHLDETGLRVDGKIHWVHTACNEQYTWLSVQDKRGSAGMEAAGFLPSYKGIAVHDFWKPDWHVEQVAAHAVCHAHILRELKGAEELSALLGTPKQGRWASDLSALLIEMNNACRTAREKDEQSLAPQLMAELENRYDRIIAQGYADTPEPKQRGKRSKRGKRLALLDRLKNYKGSVCLFLHDLRVPFTNNCAEQSIRFEKVKIKVSGCFRTLSGASDFSTILSYLSSAAKHGICAFSAILAALSGHPDMVIFGAT